MKTKALGLFLAAVILASPFYTAAAAPTKSKELAPITADNLFALVNQERARANIPALKRNTALDQAAKMKAQDELSNNYFSHISPTGLDSWYWFRKADYSFRHAGENLANTQRNYSTLRNPNRTKQVLKSSQDIVLAWMQSPSHRANILNPKYTETGTAVVGRYVVQMFGTPNPN